MTDILFHAMPTEDAENLWSVGTDAYGYLPETMISDGPGHPCRHCLANIDAGDELYVFAYRPFPALQPYAETGPVFMHKTPCRRYFAVEIQPPVLDTSSDFILRGYGANNRIVYGTGNVTLKQDIPDYAARLFERDDVSYIHVRSARNNCYQCRIDRRVGP
jgi:hypothetical protein